MIPDAPGGELCARRLQWLDRTLAHRTARRHRAAPSPVCHRPHRHGPHDSRQPARRRRPSSRRHPHVERIISGHYHRTIHARFAGTIASVCPSVAHQLLLNLLPDADIGFAFEPSAFQLHLWNGSELVTHTQVVEDFPSWGSRDWP